MAISQKKLALTTRPSCPLKISADAGATSPLSQRWQRRFQNLSNRSGKQASTKGNESEIKTVDILLNYDMMILIFRDIRRKRDYE
jgi:hypothetical protein